jgi:site-specific recombinase XerD
MYLFKRNGIYYVQYFDEIQNRERRISTKEKKKPDAIRFVSELKEKLKERPKNTFIMLSDFHIKYLQFVKDNLSPNYARIVDLAFRQLKEFTGDVSLENLHYLQLEKFITESFKRTKEGTRSTYIALKSAFNKGISWNYVNINHFTKIKLPKIPKNNPVFIKEEEFNLLLPLETDSLLKDVYQFAFYTGLRLSEIINLKWNEIDIADGIIRVRNTIDFTTKSKRERIVPINETVRNILTSRFPKIVSLERNNYVFSKNGVKLNGDYLTKNFKKCIRESSLNPQLHFHNLRHSFASNMAVKGVSIFIIKELLGHRDVKTTQIYSHLRSEDLKHAISMLNN